MTKLATIFLIITSPEDMRGTVLESLEPVPCAENVIMALDELEENGIMADARCVYTHAPAETQRPVPRQ